MVESNSIEDRIRNIEEEEEAERVKLMFWGSKYVQNQNFYRSKKSTKKDLLKEIQ